MFKRSPTKVELALLEWHEAGSGKETWPGKERHFSNIEAGEAVIPHKTNAHRNLLSILEDLDEGGKGDTIEWEDDGLLVDVDKAADDVAFLPPW